MRILLEYCVHKWEEIVSVLERTKVIEFVVCKIAKLRIHFNVPKFVSNVSKIMGIVFLQKIFLFLLES